MNAAKDIAFEHVIRKLDIKCTFKPQHDIDTGVRRHAVRIKIVGRFDKIHILVQASMGTEYRADTGFHLFFGFGGGHK